MKPQRRNRNKSNSRRDDGCSLTMRSAGILLHPTSLPGPHGTGDVGPAARDFVNWLAAAGQRWWQMLPVGPVGAGNSPYSALSAFAGSPLLISLEHLADDGLLSQRDIRPVRGLSADHVNYSAVERFKLTRLRRAADAFIHAGGLQSQPFREFCERESYWLDDHALYTAIRKQQGGKFWTRWPKPLRLRHKPALRAAADQLAADVNFERFVQFEFDRQWRDLRRAANDAGIALIGDIPFFVSHDSSDVWAQRPLFDLLPDGRARTISGVPPDCFSKTGQRWGHPQYSWHRHEKTGFAWWIARFARIFSLFDAVRIDHFLGFYRVWSVPGHHRTAKNGTWKRTPGNKLLSTLQRQLGELRIIAEDLGVVTDAAFALRDRFGFPGMRLVHFAFGNDTGDRYNQPHSHPPNCVAYPGTHDNETTVQWLDRLRREDRRSRKGEFTPWQRLLRYLGPTSRELHWDVIRLVQGSSANLAIIPLQDALGLGAAARMNIPATTRGNWEWRVSRRALTNRVAARLRELADAFGRNTNG